MMPNFFIVGAARSGTTSLDRYLNQHPEIYLPLWKETHFFAGETFPSHFIGPGDERLNRLLMRDEERFARLYADVGDAKAIGEASAFYLCYSDTAQRIAEAVPDAKILIVLREPVSRTYSAYTFLLRDGRETLGLQEGLSREQDRKQQGFEPMWWYKELSMYYTQVKHYLDVFGTPNVKVLLYNELYNEPQRVLRDVFAFLGVREDVSINTSVRYNPAGGVPKSRRLYTLVDNFIYNPNFLEKRIKSLIPSHLRMKWASQVIGMFSRPVPIDPEMQAYLKDCFAEDVGKLEDLLGRDLQCWRYREQRIA